jgi:hypothetical protein
VSAFPEEPVAADQTKNTFRPAETPKPIAWLLLREHHAVPLLGLSPEELKRSREETIEHPTEALRHLSGLNAIVDSLGFDGDFGDYQNDHWPKLKARLEQMGCSKRVDLFARDTYRDLAFRASRRALADRYYLGPTPRPTHVFLGTIDHFERYTREELRNTNFSRQPPRVADGATFPELQAAVFANRHDLYGYWNFLGDQLVRPVTSPFVWQRYFTNEVDPAERAKAIEKAEAVVALFRRAIELGPKGWVELVPITERLLLLRGPEGIYDFVWKALREDAPPPSTQGKNLQDLPLFVRRRLFGNELTYFDTTVWAERDTHESELLYYRSGGRAGLHYPGSDELLRRYYESRQAQAVKWVSRSRCTLEDLTDLP